MRGTSEGLLELRHGRELRYVSTSITTVDTETHCFACAFRVLSEDPLTHEDR